jgi:O2-independent ubiquinone biosynthesis accessory factor UbiT
MKPLLVPLRTVLRLLPDRVHTELLSRVMNQLLKGQAIKEQLDYLDGKRLCLAVTDTGNALMFQITGQSITRCPSGHSWDVRISGGLEHFWLLATRAEDPDTLFFQRQLAIEGDTDAGLYLKNLLDTLEFDLDAHLEAVVGRRWAPVLRGALDRSGLPRALKSYA